MKRLRRQVRHVSRVPVGEVARVRRRSTEQEHRPDHVEDHEKYQPGTAEVRPGETGPAVQSFRRVPHSDDREDDDPRERRKRDGVLQEAEQPELTDDRDMERRGEQRAVGLDVDGEQQHEGPEHEEVGKAGDRPLQQFALAKHLAELNAEVTADVLPDGRDPLRRGLAAGRDPAQPPHPPRGDRKRDHGHGEANDDSQDHSRPPCRRWMPAYAAPGSVSAPTRPHAKSGTLPSDQERRSRGAHYFCATTRIMEPRRQDPMGAHAPCRRGLLPAGAAGPETPLRPSPVQMFNDAGGSCRSATPTDRRCVCSCTPLRSSARTNMITAASRHQRIRLRINRVAADQVTCGDPGNPTQAACAHLIYFSAATPACVTPERPGSGRAHGRPGEGPPALTRPQAEPHTYPERLPPRGADRTRGARLNATGASWRYHASGGAASTPAA